MAANQQTVKKERRGLFTRIKDTFAELKKVNWPSFRTVVKSTGIVLGVVLFFLVVTMVIDISLGSLYSQLVQGLPQSGG